MSYSKEQSLSDGLDASIKRHFRSISAALPKVINLRITNADLDRLLSDAQDYPGRLPFAYVTWGMATVEILLHPVSGLLAFAEYGQPSSLIYWGDYPPFSLEF